LRQTGQIGDDVTGQEVLKHPASLRHREDAACATPTPIVPEKHGKQDESFPLGCTMPCTLREDHAHPRGVAPMEYESPSVLSSTTTGGIRECDARRSRSCIRKGQQELRLARLVCAPGRSWGDQFGIILARLCFAEDNPCGLDGMPRSKYSPELGSELSDIIGRAEWLRSSTNGVQ